MDFRDVSSVEAHATRPMMRPITPMNRLAEDAKAFDSTSTCPS